MTKSTSTNKQAGSTKNSRNGMIFTAEELCSIIRVCSEAGVTEMELGDMRLAFGKSPKPTEKIEIPLPTVTIPEPVTTLTESQHTQLTEESMLHTELGFKEQEVDELLLTDPLAAEEMMIKGELTADGN